MFTPQDLFDTAVFGIVVGTAALTLSRAAIFRKLRNFIKRRSKFLGKLLRCPFCTSFWVALLPAAYYQPLETFPLSELGIVFFAAPSAWVIYKSYSIMGK